MELRTDCPLCKDLHHNCFVEQTTIEEKPFESFICFQCGMTSNTYLAFDSEKLEEYTESHSQLMNDLKIFDNERGIVWFPSVINMGKLGMIYPEGKVDDYNWKYAKVVDIPEAERVNYNNHSQKLDVENAETFEQQDFMGACKAMGITERLDNG
jgi:hypothetical protein